MEELGVENCPEIDNRVLEKALSTQRQMKVWCGYTKVDPYEFMASHKDAIKIASKYPEFQRYACGKLLFIHTY